MEKHLLLLEVYERKQTSSRISYSRGGTEVVTQFSKSMDRLPPSAHSGNTRFLVSMTRSSLGLNVTRLRNTVLSSLHMSGSSV